MNEFTNKYKNLSNIELLMIIEESIKYKPVAIKTAELEIQNRNISKSDIREAKSRIIEKHNKENKDFELIKLSVNKVKQGIALFVDSINPIRSDTHKPNKTVNIISLIFFIIAGFSFYQTFDLTWYIITDNRAKWDLSMIEYIIPLFFLPITVLLYYKRKKIGWIFLTIFLTYSVCSNIVFLINDINFYTTELLGIKPVFSTTSIISHILTIVFFGGFLVINCKSEIKAIYGISHRTVFLTILITTILNLSLIYFVFGKLI